ncbi:type II secretion system F family protein [Litoricolaceae bacterium]|nr:type II secretion system F family protein [Litorivicinaceae bacterium]
MFSAISRHWQTLTQPNTSSETEILSLWAPLIQSGLTVTESIQLLAEGAEQAGDKIGFQAVLVSLGRGLTLFQAIQNSSLPISDSVLQGIESAEQTGHLGEMLWLASENAKAIQTMRAKAWEAARYPLIIGSLALLILTGLIIGIVPKFESLYSRMGSELPEATQFLMSLSQLVQHHGALTLVGAVLLLLTAFYQGLKTPTGQIGWDWLMNRLPVISPLRQELFSHRLISNLELLVNSGVVLPDALRASADVIPSPSYQRALIEASRSIRQGQRSDLALNQSLLSPLMRQLWSLGVRSGRLTEFLRIGRKVLGVRLHNRLSILTSFLEPTLMAVLGLLTGGVMLALYQPIFSLGDAL